MAVTKTQSAARVNEAIAAGVTLLGENRAQELLEKYDAYDRAAVTFILSDICNRTRCVRSSIRCP